MKRDTAIAIAIVGAVIAGVIVAVAAAVSYATAGPSKTWGVRVFDKLGITRWLDKRNRRKYPPFFDEKDEKTS